MTEVLGWLSSMVLLLTIGKQVHKQWKEGASEGVSHWLFVGQCVASAGFTLYSFLVHNWVFVVTNALMLISAIAGWVILQRNRRRKARGGGHEESTPEAARASPLSSSPLRTSTR
jgi:MtN3 and saliva related transmembrane protein